MVRPASVGLGAGDGARSFRRGPSGHTGGCKAFSTEQGVISCVW